MWRWRGAPFPDTFDRADQIQDAHTVVARHDDHLAEGDHTLAHEYLDRCVGGAADVDNRR